MSKNNDKMKYERPKERFQPPEDYPPRLEVPENTLITICDDPYFEGMEGEIVEDCRKNKKREWFVPHAYFCLPITMGNQHGFIIKAAFSFDVYWNGGNSLNDLQVIIDDEEYSNTGKQVISSHFGMGVVTVQNRFSFRTPEGVNLLLTPPPNYFIDGITSMTAVLETDNLRRDFTFNLKVTRPDVWLHVEKGQPIASLLPYPRRYFDNFSLKRGEEIIDPEIIKEERKTCEYFGIERREYDSKAAGTNGFRYMDGEDVYGYKFKDHQKKVGD